MVRSTPLSSTRESRVPWASKWSRASVNGSPVTSREPCDHAGGEAGSGVEPGADRGAAEGELLHPGEHAVQSLDREPHRGGVPAELLAEGDRGGVHQVGAAGLDGVGELVGLGLQAAPRASSRPGSRSSATASAAATWMAVGKVSLEDWPALTWSLGWTLGPAQAGEVGDHLVDVHVGAGARAGLEDVDRELVGVLARRDRPGRGLDRRGDCSAGARRARRWRVRPRP